MVLYWINGMGRIDCRLILLNWLAFETHAEVSTRRGGKERACHTARFRDKSPAALQAFPPSAGIAMDRAEKRPSVAISGLDALLSKAGTTAQHGRFVAIRGPSDVLCSDALG